MRVFGAVLMSTILFAADAFGATVSTMALLPPGKPAGVKQAQMEGNTMMWDLGLAIVVGGAALVASGNGKSAISTTTTSTASH